MKKLIAMLLSLVLCASLLAGCANETTTTQEEETTTTDTTQQETADPAPETEEPAPAPVEEEETPAAPKYVFLFIGDGMSYPQIQSTSDYLGALSDADYWQAEPSLDDNQGAILDGPEYLNFMNFPVAGSAVTYDSNSFCPDSASTATSISTGHKTYSGTINMDETGTTAYETIAEQLKAQKGWEIGVISSVNLNHATPAAFYAHQASRNNYYEIGLELIDSGFDYFSGGAFLKPTGAEGDQEDLYALAEAAGYTVARTQADAEAVTDGSVIIVDEHLADGDAMAYELDRTDEMWSLADHVAKGIEVLDNDNGFFLMCEGGKIDWACHANDAASSIHDTMALADAVQVAIDFAAEHPEETLIVVTGDHETGGLTIGFAGTDYDTYLNLLESQKISYAKFDSDYVSAYKENKTPFEEAMADVTELFGLKTEGEEGDKLVLTDYDTYLNLLESQKISFAKYDSDYVAAYKENKTSFEDVLADIETLFGLKTQGEEGDKLVLTPYELSQIKTAYEKSINETATGMDEQQEYVMYGTYEPLTVTITHILNNKSGVSFTSYSHTGLPVAVLADGVNAEVFNGYYDNTEVYNKLADMLNIK